jgi:hypothetical protein
VGCTSQSPSPANPEPSPAARNISEDERILLALDCYEPIYKLDAEGHVTHLRMSGRHLPFAVMTEIGKLTQLQVFHCDWTTATDEGVAQLTNLKNLRSFGLGGTAITDKSLLHLEKLPSLRWVWVPAAKVSKEGLANLKEARPDMNVYPQ